MQDTWASPKTPAATDIAQGACGGVARLAGREADMLPVGYFHIVFTAIGPVADTAGTRTVNKVLGVGSGTGVLAREALRRIGK